MGTAGEQVLQNTKDGLQNIGLTNPLKPLRSKACGRGGIGRRKGLKIPYTICYRLDFVVLFYVQFCNALCRNQSETMENNHFCKTFRDRKLS